MSPAESITVGGLSKLGVIADQLSGRGSNPDPTIEEPSGNLHRSTEVDLPVQLLAELAERIVGQRRQIDDGR